MRSKRHTTLVATGVLLAVVLVAAASAGNNVAACTLRSVDKAAYVAKNEQILRRIPVFSGSKLVTRYSIGQTASDSCLPVENGPPYSAFGTWHVYKSAKQPPGAIVRFYRKRLLARGWQYVGRSGLSGPALDSTFRRGAAVVYVKETSGRPAGGWYITVDHAMAK